MNHRCLAAVLTVIAVVALTPILAAAQSTNPTAPPRTPWGHPDLQGIWNNATITPFERPEELADQEFLTEEEVANLEQATVDRNDRLWRAPSRRAEAGGDVGAYNNFWMERGTTVVPTGRTSMIVDPQDGRLPPLTPEAHNRLTSPEAQRLADVRRGRLPADSWDQGLGTEPATDD